MKTINFTTNNFDRLVKIQSYLKENYDINVGKVLPKRKLEKAYNNVEQRIFNLRNKGNKFQQDPNYGMNIMVRDALGIMLKESIYYEGENFGRMMEELYEYGCSLAETGDDYDTVMASCGKKYETMPVRFPMEMIMTRLGEMMMQGPFNINLAKLGEEQPVVEEPIVELDKKEDTPEDIFTNALAKRLGKDPSDYSLSELFSEMESIDIGLADKMYDLYVNKCREIDCEPVDLKEASFDCFLDSLVDEMVTEEIAGTTVEEAEVVMAARALSNDIQDHIERLGRMMNEDLPAISDSMSHEFGVEKASEFRNSMEELLTATLEANRGCKDGIDSLLGGITGQGSAAEVGVGDEMSGMDDMGGLDAPALDEPVDDFDGADAEAGPIDEPLGRAEKE